MWSPRHQIIVAGCAATLCLAAGGSKARVILESNRSLVVPAVEAGGLALPRSARPPAISFLLDDTTCPQPFGTGPWRLIDWSPWYSWQSWQPWRFAARPYWATPRPPFRYHRTWSAP